MAHYLERNKYVPIDKSHCLRMVWLDTLRSTPEFQYQRGLNFLGQNYSKICADLQAVHDGGTDWKKGKKAIRVGESGTFYRCARLAAWGKGMDVEFDKIGTLVERAESMYSNPDVLDMTSEERLQLDGGTSQWETAAFLFFYAKDPYNPLPKVEDTTGHPKLKVTYSAVDEWEIKWAMREPWQPRTDRTILRQAVSFLRMLHLGERDFDPEDEAENYCFARAFGYMTREEGERRWPQLRKHESDRLEAMEIEIERAMSGKVIESPDHRVATACEMLMVANGMEPKIKHRTAPSKAWPEFPAFIKQAPFLTLDEALEQVA